jgi:hypothetical protein
MYRVTKCVDSDSWLKIKIKKLIFYLTLSPPSEISRTADDQLAVPYCTDVRNENTCSNLF